MKLLQKNVLFKYMILLSPDGMCVYQLLGVQAQTHVSNKARIPIQHTVLNLLI